MPTALIPSIFTRLPRFPVIEPMLDDQAITGEEAKGMFDQVNQTRLQILQTWSNGGSAKHLEAQLPG